MGTMNQAPATGSRTGPHVSSVRVTLAPGPLGTAAAKPAPERGASRVRSLDGLRGIAALVVVMNHIVIAVVPVFALTYITAVRPTSGSSLRWLEYSPLRLFWSGPQAVTLFLSSAGSCSRFRRFARG